MYRYNYSANLFTRKTLNPIVYTLSKSKKALLLTAKMSIKGQKYS